ncbi:CH033-like protein [Mya arenaria]|uniref:CH033-like protein n=1 Tax=Mya arenaria TaxID=6604 RepID=A0ABY7F2W4_MYAAR|nr:CH033-like protein [Mya arenaria]
MSLNHPSQQKIPLNKTEDASRYLKVLLSAKAPLIKKRQAMRNAFGDYRKKMQEMERKSTAVAKRAKLSSGEVGEGKGQKSLFFKRSLAKTSKSTNSYVGDHLQNEPDTSSPASVGNQSKCTHSCESNNQSSIMQSCDNSNQSSVGKEGSGDVDATNGLDANFKFNFTISDDNDPDMWPGVRQISLENDQGWGCSDGLRVVVGSIDNCQWGRGGDMHLSYRKGTCTARCINVWCSWLGKNGTRDGNDAVGDRIHHNQFVAFADVGYHLANDAAGDLVVAVDKHGSSTLDGFPVGGGVLSVWIHRADVALSFSIHVEYVMVPPKKAKGAVGPLA